VNEEFKYPKYFSMLPNGPTPYSAFTRGFFAVAMAQNPRPQSVALAAADAEFGRNACNGARAHAKAAGLKLVLDSTYPTSTTNFAPIVRAVQVANPDLVVFCSYPLDTVGLIAAVNTLGYKPKMWGGAMVGLQATVLKAKLGPMLNGITNFEHWIPARTMQFPGSIELLRKYQERARQEQQIDPLGWYMSVWAYAYLQVLGDAVTAIGSIEDDKLARYIHSANFKTVVGDVKFGRLGEWENERVLAVQFQNIKGNALNDISDPSTQVIVYPPEFKSGHLIYPYEQARN
jgi:branched-chain amino acid transport system substrate-binding protein